ncbi:MAG: LysM peptidoglycan-binding domain-containing protein [Bacteroidota bacterium]
MKLNKSLIVFFAIMLVGSIAVAQEMTKEQWQQEMNRYRTQVNDLTAKLAGLNKDIAEGQTQSAKLDADLNKCLDELYALVGSDREKAAAYRVEIEAAENKANELLRLSDAELLSRSGEVDDLEAKSKVFWANKLSLIPEFWDRLTALDDKIKSLRNTITGSGKTYTVGTWARNRDCLWNIAKKQDVYGDAWLWPKIWQGNRSQISDPDVIHPGQKLKIPAKAGLTSEEKSAANSYYRGK